MEFKYDNSNSSNHLLESLIDNISGGVCIFSFDMNINTLFPVYLNKGFSTLMPTLSTSDTDFSNSFFHLIHENDRDTLLADLQSCIVYHSQILGEYRYYKSNNKLGWIQIRMRYMNNEQNTHLLSAILFDITQEKQREYELKLQTERYNLITEFANEPLFEYNKETDTLVITYMKNGQPHNSTLENYYSKLSYSLTIHPDDYDTYQNTLSAAIASPIKSFIDIRTKLFDDVFTWYRITFVSITRDDNDVSRIVGRFSNIQKNVMESLNLRNSAELDSLTSLYNKGVTSCKISELLQSIKMDSTVKHALFMIDIDNFKNINDTFGHITGDDVLVEVSNIIESTFRSTSDIIGRVGGDEFMVLLNNIPDISLVQTKAKQLCDRLNRDYEDYGITVSISASIGIAIYPEHGTTYTDLYSHADIALYNVKATTKNGYLIYDPNVEYKHSSKISNSFSKIESE